MDDLKDVPLPERPSRLYYLGLTTIILIAVAGIVTHFVVLHRVMNLEEEKAAWNAAVDQRLQEEKRLSAQLQSRRDEYLTIQKSADAAKAYLAARQKELSDLQSTIAPLKHQAETAQADRQKAQTEYDALSIKVASLAEALKVSQNRLDQAQGGIEQAEGRKKGLEDAVSAANRDLAEKQIQLHKLNDDLAAATQTLGQRNAERPQLEAGFKKLQQEGSSGSSVEISLNS